MEYEIETAHGRLFCRREGSGPILLLIHGVACDSEFFRETSKLLAETFTVISYDRRGYSRSIAAEGENDFSVWAHAEDAADLLAFEEGDQHVLFQRQHAVLHLLHHRQVAVDDEVDDGVQDIVRSMPQHLRRLLQQAPQFRVRARRAVTDRDDMIPADEDAGFAIDDLVRL